MAYSNMLSEKQIRQLIITRLDIVDGQCNSWYLNHNDGIFRGLLWALTGKDPGTNILSDVKNLLELAGIKHTLKDDEVCVVEGITNGQ